MNFFLPPNISCLTVQIWLSQQRWPSDLNKTFSETVPSDSQTTHIGGQIMERSAELHFLFPEKEGLLV